MQNFKSRSFDRRLIYSWPVVIVVLSVAVFLGQAAVRSYLGSRNARSAYLEVKKKHDDLASQRADLEKRLDYLSTSYGLERELRSKFGLIKPGENLMIIVDRPNEVSPEEKSGFYSVLSEVGLFLKDFWGAQQ